MAGQGVVADDGDAEALAVPLGQRNFVDLVSLQVGLKQHTHTHTTCFSSQSTPSNAVLSSSEMFGLTVLLCCRWGGVPGSLGGGGNEEIGEESGGSGGGGAVDRGPWGSLAISMVT